MKNINKLLVVIDPTVERDHVVDRAMHLASSLDAQVELFVNNANTLTEHSYIYEGVDGQFFETQRRLFEEHYMKLLNGLEKDFLAANIEVSCEFREGHNLAEAIITRATETEADLVLKSTHHHSTVERALVTNTDWRLIRKCPTPLLLVKPNPWLSDGSIVTAIDPMHSKAEQSKLDLILLASARRLAGDLNCEPLVFHSYYPFVSTLFPMGGETREHLDRVREEHLHKVLEKVGGYEIPKENIHLSEGDLIPSLIEFLGRHQANMLVVGALSRNALERAIVGNTAEKILEHCPCDVLVMKS